MKTDFLVSQQHIWPLLARMKVHFIALSLVTWKLEIVSGLITDPLTIC